jgi:hypothetical protein
MQAFAMWLFLPERIVGNVQTGLRCTAQARQGFLARNRYFAKNGSLMRRAVLARYRRSVNNGASSGSADTGAFIGTYPAEIPTMRVSRLAKVQEHHSTFTQQRIRLR